MLPHPLLAVLSFVAPTELEFLIHEMLWSERPKTNKGVLEAIECETSDLSC